MQTHAVSSVCAFGCLTQHVAKGLDQVLARGRWVRFGALAVLGVFAGLGQAPLDLWPATIAGLALILLVLRSSPTPKQAAFHGWAFGVGYFGFTLRWIVEPFLVDIARHGWMAPFAIALMAAGAGLFWALTAGFAKRFAPQSLLMFGLAFVVAEVTRSLILSGFPWALLGHSLIPTHLAQLAAFGGPHLLTLIVCLLAVALAMFAERPRQKGMSFVLTMFLLGAVTAATWAPPDAPTDTATGPIVRLVQPNAPQHQKWDPAYRDIYLNRMVALTGQGDVPDLVVWPETAVPYLLNYISDDLSLLSDAARGAPLVYGVQRTDAAGQFFNSLVVMGRGGEVQSLYDKRHLVTFGEYIPGARLLGKAGMTGLARNLGTGFTPGVESGPINIPGIGGAIPMICYEGIFAEEITDGGDRARLLLLITNDAWFGKAAGPYQHLAQARLRAIEQGLPMVRVANTGISAMIDAKGKIVGSLPLGVDGAIDVALPAALPPTLYVRVGDWPLFGVLLMLTLGHYARRNRNSD